LEFGFVVAEVLELDALGRHPPANKTPNETASIKRVCFERGANLMVSFLLKFKIKLKVQAACGAAAGACSAARAPRIRRHSLSNCETQ
jgi:hypothetical protein